MLTNNWTVTIVFNNVQNKQMHAELKSVFSITLHFRGKATENWSNWSDSFSRLDRKWGGRSRAELNSSSFSIYCIPQKVLPAKLILAFFAHAYMLFSWLEYFICLIHSYRLFKIQFKFYFSEKPSPQPFHARLVPLCISCIPLWENSSNYYLLVCFLPLESFFFLNLLNLEQVLTQRWCLPTNEWK